MSGVVPVFVLNNQLPGFDQKLYTTAEICSAAEKTSGYQSLIGAQRIGGLWRVYPHSLESRNKLLVAGFVLRGVQIEVKDKNPFLVTSPDGEEREVPATKLIISNIPLSFSDEEILKSVKNLGVSIRSKLIDERDRDKDGRLTRWKTGRRFIYIDIPETPLPKSVKIGPFTAALFHKEQRDAQKLSAKECTKCLQKGHSSAQCSNPIKCRQCLQDGHKAGDPKCGLVPATMEKQQESHTVNLESSSNHESSSAIGPITTDKTSDCNTSKERDRGRPTKKQRHSHGKSRKGQMVLNFPRSSSRSASSKRPRSTDSAPSPSMGTHLQQEKEQSASDHFEETSDYPVT